MQVSLRAFVNLHKTKWLSAATNGDFTNFVGIWIYVMFNNLTEPDGEYYWSQQKANAVVCSLGRERDKMHHEMKPRQKINKRRKDKEKCVLIKI